VAARREKERLEAEELKAFGHSVAAERDEEQKLLANHLLVNVGGSSSTIKRNLLRIRSSQQLFQLYSTSAMVCLSRSSTMGFNPYAVYYQVALNIIDCQ
jgi:hypothetical protein